jgi:hypothetical protein
VYTIYTKTLYYWFQPILKEIIHPYQIIFLPFLYILENVFLLYELLDCAKWTKQNVKLFKFDFAKAYDKAIVVNTWRAKVDQLIDIARPCYDLCIEKTFPLGFFKHNQTRHAWSWALTIMNKFRCNLFFGPWMRFSIGQCLFGEDPLQVFK